MPLPWHLTLTGHDAELSAREPGVELELGVELGAEAKEPGAEERRGHGQ